ncbi:hypothetical protein [Streptomyces sp. NPDC096032]|uniref:nSTAND1 domain-containing NTPase n=1 Tax=Streptomyces sp. NPDC096032 TaxID=3366070 RepID=UPI00382E9CAE
MCPYRGLEPFTAEHAQWFEGRKDAVRQVLANLAQQQRVMLLLGPSGSGKSSLVQAGVLPALAAGELPGSDRWLPILARPGQDLLAELERAGLPGAASDGIAAAVTRKLEADPTLQRVVLIIDQFEELLTQSLTGRQQERRVAATDQLTAAVKSHAALSVILIMRDDFYSQQAALAPKLLKAAMPGLLNVPGTLSQEDLHDIITLPAQDVGLRFQPGLTELMITDVLATSPEGAITRQAPVTVLPLLELTLSQLWKRRHDGYLTHDAYRRIGGVTGSLTTWCDTALNRLPPDHRPVAQRILTSLVRPADPDHHIPAIRKQVSLQDLRDLAADPPSTQDSGNAFDDVIAALTGQRIITTHTPRTSGLPDAPPGQPVAELIHDAVIRDWGTLREWVRQDHRFHEWLDHAREQRARWADGTDPGDLLGGTALGEGLEWSQHRRLPVDIATFLTTSKQRQQAAIRRSRRLNTVLATLLVLALTAGAGAVWQWRTVVAKRQADLSRQLAAQSGTLISNYPDLASLLAIQAYRTSHTAEAIKSLEAAAALPLQRRLTGHNEPVWSVVFSPDGKTLASGSDDKTVRLWSTATGKKVRTLAGPTGPVWSMAYSPDGKTLAIGDSDTVWLWNTATGKPRTPLTGHTGGVNAMAFSRDGKTLATASDDKTVRLWNPATGKKVRTLTGHTGGVNAVAFSPDGKTLATASDDTTVRLWDTATGKTVRTLTGHIRWVHSVVFSPDGKALASGSGDTTVRLWDTATGKKVRTLTDHGDQVLAVAFSPDGKTLATASNDKTVRLWNPATGKTVRTLTGHTGGVNAVVFSPDGKTLATASDDKTVRLWSTTADQGVHSTLAFHTGPVWKAVFNPDGKVLATASDNRTVRLWDTATGKKVHTTTLTSHTEHVTAVAFSPDGKSLASGSSDGTIRLWDTATGKPRTTLAGHNKPVWAVAFSPDGKFLASGSDDTTVRLWDTATGKKVRTLTGHGDQVLAVAFSPDGKTLASGSSDTTVRLWDTATGKSRTTLAGHNKQVRAVAFSPDGKSLASGSLDGTVRLWGTTVGEPRTTLTGQDGPVWAVVFSPDGKTLATASGDKTVRLWNPTSSSVRATLTGVLVVFSPDGKTLATASSDNTVRLWDVILLQPDTAIQKICEAVNRDLTAGERTTYLPGHSIGPACHPR